MAKLPYSRTCDFCGKEVRIPWEMAEELDDEEPFVCNDCLAKHKYYKEEKSPKELPKCKNCEFLVHAYDSFEQSVLYHKCSKEDRRVNYPYLRPSWCPLQERDRELKCEGLMKFLGALIKQHGGEISLKEQYLQELNTEDRISIEENKRENVYTLSLKEE